MELARAIVLLGEVRGLESFTLPYPPRVQLAFDRFVLHCLSRGLPPPRSVSELVLWCRNPPASGWPFAVPRDLAFPDARLVDEKGLVPTRTCYELASAGPLGFVEQEAAELLGRVEDSCHSAELFRRCRDFLIARPIVSQRASFPRSRNWDSDAWRLVRDLYQGVPKSLIVREVLATCGTCGMPALTSQDDSAYGIVWCEGGRCPRDVDPELNYHAAESRILNPGLRTFLSLPGRTEIKALARLDRAEIKTEFIPSGLGLHRISLSEGPCIMSVYDREQPALLAARVAETFSGVSDRVLVVVPADLLKGRTEYQREFKKCLPAEIQVSLTTPDRLARSCGTRLAPTRKDKS